MQVEADGGCWPTGLQREFASHFLLRGFLLGVRETGLERPVACAALLTASRSKTVARVGNALRIPLTICGIGRRPRSDLRGRAGLDSQGKQPRRCSQRLPTRTGGRVSTRSGHKAAHQGHERPPPPAFPELVLAHSLPVEGRRAALSAGSRLTSPTPRVPEGELP